MSTAHRSIDGTSMHPGLIDQCPECAPTSEPGKHFPDEHHTFCAPALPAPGLPEFCLCGRLESSPIHDTPYCTSCVVIEPDPLDFGAPQPFWFRLYSRLVARFGKRY